MQTLLIIIAAASIAGAFLAVISVLDRVKNIESDVLKAVSEFSKQLGKVADALEQDTVSQRLQKMNSVVDGITKQINNPFDRESAILPFPDSKHLRIYQEENQ